MLAVTEDADCTDSTASIPSNRSITSRIFGTDVRPYGCLPGRLSVGFSSPQGVHHESPRRSADGCQGEGLLVSLAAGSELDYDGTDMD